MEVNILKKCGLGEQTSDNTFAYQVLKTIGTGHKLTNVSN